MEHAERRDNGWWNLRRYRRVAIATVAGLALLTVAGGFVRLTGSGLGCDDWPNCNDERFIDVSSGHTAIEQLNRLLSGFIAVPTVLMAVGAWKLRRLGRRLGPPAAAVLVTVLANAVVGGIAVRVDLHPALVQSHFLLAMASIAAGVVAIHRSASSPPMPAASAGVGVALVGRAWLLTILTAAALVTGTVVTGTGPHAGDEEARRFGFDISNVARIHSISVIAAVAAALWLVGAIQQRASMRRRYSSAVSTWMFLAIVQGAIGYVQYFNGVPEALVGTHIAGATALWIATVALVASVVEPVGDARSSGADDRVHGAAVGAGVTTPVGGVVGTASGSVGTPVGDAVGTEVHTPETGDGPQMPVGPSPTA